MVKTRMVKRTVIILLVISLIYSNLSMIISGCISYALDKKENADMLKENAENLEEQKELEIQISEFCKNNMIEQETEYIEKLAVNVQYEEKFNEIIISDIDTIIDDGLVNEEGSEEEIKEKTKINTFYRTTKINKTELINAIGKNGSLEINYNELGEDDTTDEMQEEKQEEVIVETVENEEADVAEVNENQENEESLEENENKGKIVAENGIVILNSETEADEEDYITIIYPKNTVSLNIKILATVNTVENFNIVNNKIIEKVENLAEVNQIKTTKQIEVNGEETLLNNLEVATKTINYTQTLSELGIDRTQISTSVANKVNFTITMHTNEAKYDLYKNPYYIIELPNIVENITLDNIVILNNQYFSIAEIKEGTLENGNKAIGIKLEGEQTEHAKSVEENIQIVVETTIKTQNLLPTTQEDVLLYYQNENAKTYNGISEEENGISQAKMEFVSNEEIIVESKAVIGEQIISSPRDTYNSVIVEPHTYNTATIVGTVINNLGEDIQNVKILGSATNVGQISGVEKVYYTANQSANTDLGDNNNGWSTEYLSDAKKYLIIIDDFKQAQTLTFEYEMILPENIENDILHVAQFDVYNNENQIIKMSKVTINQIAERFDIFEDDLIKASIVTENAEVNDITNVYINIENVSGRKLEGISLDVTLPENLEIEMSNTTINGIQVSGIKSSGNKEHIKISEINIASGVTFQVELIAKVTGNKVENNNAVVNIEYEKGQAQILNPINTILPSNIETTITSDKLGKTLEANEKIEYTVTLKNSGAANANVDVNVSPLENMLIQKIESENLTTGKTKTINSGDLNGDMYDISINPGETVEISIECLAKELKKDATEIMYVNITGDKIYSTTTEELVNQINKKVEEGASVKAQLSNTIKGIAWVDDNENGRKDNNEILLKNVQAILIDTINSKEVARETTNSKGEYEFENVQAGNYLVEFKYNTNTLTVTDYKNEKVPTSLASAVINTTQNNVTTAKTEIIKMEEGSVETANIGFVANKNFDVSINKGITKVTVDNEQGTEIYEFDSNSMAKVEIDGEYLKGSIILVEYEVAVTNNGEIAGYVKKIADKIPKGMKFNSELNTDWYEGNDGKVYCESLANKKLMPGETTTVKLVLTKEMTEDKVISPVNTANIEETFNEYLIEDKNKENNTAEATIIISLSTGSAPTYIMLILTIIGIISLGAFGTIKIIKKDIRKRD